MKDETKEIQYELNILSNTILDETTYSPTIRRRKRLLNYITNLQEENERLNKVIISQYKELQSLFNHLTKKDLNYKSRNEKAIEYLPEVRKTPSYELDEKIDNLESILNGDDE